MISLDKRPEIKEAFAIFNTGAPIKLIQKHNHKIGLSQCLFFDGYLENDYRLEFRLDFNDLDVNRNPTLDLEIFKEGKKIKIAPEIHHTSKIFKDEWIYEWPGIQAFNLSLIQFKLETTNTKSISGSARIVRPNTSL